jgi:meckelin
LLGTGIHSFCCILSLIIFFLAFIQYFFYIIFYQRLIEDKIINFIDLCSVSNISVFILDQTSHGYYIHGRSPHGTTDVNMKDMVMNLERESRLMSGTRGLQANSKEQLFIMKINRLFRIQYDLLFGKYYVKKVFFFLKYSLRLFLF